MEGKRMNLLPGSFAYARVCAALLPVSRIKPLEITGHIRDKTKANHDTATQINAEKLSAVSRSFDVHLNANSSSQNGQKEYSQIKVQSLLHHESSANQMPIPGVYSSATESSTYVSAGSSDHDYMIRERRKENYKAESEGNISTAPEKPQLNGKVLWYIDNDNACNVDHEEVVEAINSKSTKDDLNFESHHLQLNEEDGIHLNKLSNELQYHNQTADDWKQIYDKDVGNHYSCKSAVNMNYHNKIVVDPIKHAFTINQNESLQTIKPVYCSDDTQEIVVQTIDSPYTIDHEEVVESLEHLSEPSSQDDRWSQTCANTSVILNKDIQDSHCNAEIKQSLLQLSDHNTESGKLREEVGTMNFANQRQSYKSQTAQPQFINSLKSPLKGESFKSPTSKLHSLKSIKSPEKSEPIKSPPGQSKSLKLHMVFAQNFLQKSMNECHKKPHYSQKLRPYEADNVAPPSANSLQSGMQQVLDLASFRPVSPDDELITTPFSPVNQDSGIANNKQNKISSKLNDNKRRTSSKKGKADCIVDNLVDNKSSLCKSDLKGSGDGDAKTVTGASPKCVYDDKNENKTSKSAKKTEDNSHKAGNEKLVKQIRLRVSLKGLLQNAKSHESSPNNDLFIKSPIRCDICPKSGKKGRPRKCEHIILAQQAFLKSIQSEDCKTPTSKEPPNVCKTPISNKTSSKTEINKKLTKGRSSPDKANDGVLNLTTVDLKTLNSKSFKNGEKVKIIKLKTPPKQAKKILTTFNQQLREDDCFQLQLKETSEWLTSRWRSYMDADVDTLRDFEVENAIDYSFNDDAKAMVGDGNRYVWQLIEQI